MLVHVLMSYVPSHVIISLIELLQELPSFTNLHPSTLSPLLQTPPTPGGSLTNLPMGNTGASQQQQAMPTTPPIPGPQAAPGAPAATAKQPSKGLRLSVSSSS